MMSEHRRTQGDKDVFKQITLEDTALGYLAKERDLKSTPDDYMDLDIAEKKLKTKK